MEKEKDRVIDELGRIVLPAEFRRALHMEVKERVSVMLEDGAIVIRKEAGCETAKPEQK